MTARKGAALYLHGRAVHDEQGDMQQLHNTDLSFPHGTCTVTCFADHGAADLMDANMSDADASDANLIAKVCVSWTRAVLV